MAHTICAITGTILTNIIIIAHKKTKRSQIEWILAKMRRKVVNRARKKRWRQREKEQKYDPRRQGGIKSENIKRRYLLIIKVIVLLLSLSLLSEEKDITHSSRGSRSNSSGN